MHMYVVLPCTCLSSMHMRTDTVVSMDKKKQICTRCIKHFSVEFEELKTPLYVQYVRTFANHKGLFNNPHKTKRELGHPVSAYQALSHPDGLVNMCAAQLRMCEWVDSEIVNMRVCVVPQWLVRKCTQRNKCELAHTRELFICSCTCMSSI
jgi:hypothetical protein